MYDDLKNKAYIRLAGAILKQAADDYIDNLKIGDEKKCAKLEEFFRSSYCRLLSMDQGEAIIRNCRRIAQEERRDTMKQKE